MKVVILAGGRGTRLNEETESIPKPMVEIGGLPILWHIMKIYSHYGLNDFVICLGYRGYVIKEFFKNYYLHSSDVTVNLQTGEVEVHQNRSEPWKVTLVDTGQETLTGGRLKRVANYINDEPFCFTYGDGVANLNIGELLKFHTSHGKLATVTAITPPGRFGTLEMKGQIVSKMAEKVPQENSPINGGFFVLDPSVTEMIDDDLTIWERGPMEGLAKQKELAAFRHNGFWHPMDTLRDKIYLNQLWNSNDAPWKIWV